MGFGPAHVHTHEHLRPVLALRAACAAVNLHHAVHGVFLLAQHILEFKVFNGVDCLGVVLVNLLLRHHLVVVEVESQLQFVGQRAHLFISVNPAADAFHLFHLLLRGLGVVPEVGRLGAQFFLFKFYFLLVYVKIAVQRVGALHHIFQLFGCYHLFYGYTVVGFYGYAVWSLGIGPMGLMSRIGLMRLVCNPLKLIKLPPLGRAEVGVRLLLCRRPSLLHTSFLSPGHSSWPAPCALFSACW